MGGTTKVVIRPYDSKAFPWEARVGIHSWVFETLEIAKAAMEGRFGKCIFTVKA